jgi:hypothetical protein
VSRRPLNGGDVIMQEIPLASVVLEEWAAYVCHQCFCMVPRLASCAACKQVGWCSEECERIGAVAHRAGGSHCECDALKRLDADVLRDGDTALAKLFVKLLCRRVVEAGAGGAEGMVDSSLALLESNEDAIGDDRISDIAMIAEVVLDAVHPAARIEQEELEGYMCAEQCNSFGIWGETGSGRDKLLGFGIFPRLCMFNHSCLPNVTISQTVNNRVRTLTAHTLAPVAAGDELCISYSEAKLLDDREARRAWLRKTYLFECACVLCCAPEATATDLVRHFNARYGVLKPGARNPESPAAWVLVDHISLAIALCAIVLGDTLASSATCSVCVF